MSPVDDSGINDDPLSFSIGGKSFSWGHLAQLKNAEAFVKEAQKPARGYSNPGSYLNGGVRQFLEYLCERQLAPSQVSVEGYRAQVEQGLQSANTKYDQLSRVREFVRRLQAAGLVETFRVPANLGREPGEHKADLYEIAPVGLDQMSVLQRARADSLLLK